MLYFKNSGRNPRELEETNWWELPYPDQGYLYLSFSAGEFRLLLPPAYEHLNDDMRSASRVEVARGPWDEFGVEDAVSLIWEDGSPAPLTVRLAEGQYDLVPYRHDVQIGVGVTVLGRTGKLGAWPARFFYRHLPAVDLDTGHAVTTDSFRVA